MKIKEKIIGTLFLISLLLGIVYLSLFTSNEVKNKMEFIELSGNYHMSQNEYLTFTRLNELSKNSGENDFLNLAIIKDRFEKHPYVKIADVKFTGQNKVSVKITEKKFHAIVLCEGKHFLVSDIFELVPILSFTKNIELPVIANPYLQSKANEFDFVKLDEMKTAFKIIETARIVDKNLYSNLSEIDMRSGRDIVLSFTNLNFPIVIGRGNEVSKIIYFEKIWSKLNSSEAHFSIDYVDLRFDRLIYLCMNDSVNSRYTGNELQEIQG